MVTKAAVVASIALLGVVGTAAAAPGDVVWRDLSQRVPGGSDAYRALATSPSGDAYVAGSTSSGAGAAEDVLLRKFSARGDVVWQRVWTYPGRSTDLACDVARDRRGSIIVAGSSGTSWLLLKYGDDGYLQWVRRGRAPYARCELVAVSVDGAGNVYATGTATPPGEHRRIFTLKYSAAGALRWRTTLGSLAGDASGNDIVAGGGDVYVAGGFATGAATSKAATIKYSATGRRRWIAYHAARPGDVAAGVCVGYAAGPVVAGVGTAPGEQGDGFVVRYDASGAELWTASYAGPYDLGDRFNGMVVDASGAVCVTGTRWIGVADEMLTARFGPTGALEWAHAVTGGAPEGYAVCGAPGGAYYSAGGGLETIVSQDAAGGLPGWQRSIAPAGYTDFTPVAVAAAGSDSVYVAGWAHAGSASSAAMLIRLRP